MLGICDGKLQNFTAGARQLDDGYFPMQTRDLTWIEAGRREVVRQGKPQTSVKLLLADLKACSTTRDLGRGKQLHAEAVACGYDSSVYVASALINMYAKSGSMVDAHQVFDAIKHPNVVCWTALILGYADTGQGLTALHLFTRMQCVGAQPNFVTFVAALKACTSLAVKGASGMEECSERGKALHKLAVECGCNADNYVQNTLIDMYAKCGCMADARQVFDRMKQSDAVSWTSLILGYAECGEAHSAMDLFSRMRSDGPEPTSITFVAALRACTALAVSSGLSRGKAIHRLAAEAGFDSNIYVENTLIDMYAKCGSMSDARQVFENMKEKTVVTWTALILGYADSGQGEIALDLFRKMHTEGPAPDSVTFVAALKACTSLVAREGPSGRTECRERGEAVHFLAVQKGCGSDSHVQSALIEMYSRCGSMAEARRVFDSIRHPDVVCWTALIQGYADNGQGVSALDLYTRMKAGGLAPDSVTFAGALKACALLGALDFGRTIHSEIDRGDELDLALVTCLVDFYAKCGSLVEAQTVFHSHPDKRDTVTWNALLGGFSSCGDTESVYGLFEQMQDAGFRPDGVTFLSILTCCNHGGLVEKGKECFDTMSTKYGVPRTVEHYNCMLDIFGRANKLEDAMALLERMPCPPSNVTWMTILDACRKWKNVEIGRLAFQSLIAVNERDAGGYMLMGQIYGSRGMFQEQEMVLGVRKMLKASRTPGETCWVNEAGEVHTFLTDDTRHPQIRDIRAKWESLRECGFVVGKSADVEEKEALCGHSERLALACALINTSPGKTIRIVKNLRVCDDCHAAIGLSSKLERRTIICRDAVRIHVFKDGACSCGS